MNTIDLTILIFILSWHRSFFASGLSCYECSSVSASGQCISDVGTPRRCDKMYCTIYRQEFLDPPGKLQYFYRSCEDKPSYLNAVIQTANHRAYYRACAQNLCNIGNGLVASTAVMTNSSISEIIIVPGIGSSGERSFVSLNELVISAVIVLLLEGN